MQPVLGGRLDFGGPFRTGSADHIEFCGRPFLLSSGVCAVGGKVTGAQFRARARARAQGEAIAAVLNASLIRATP